MTPEETLTATPQELFDAHLAYVGFVMRKHFPVCAFGAEREDYEQLGRLGLWRATQTWDPEKAGFRTHAYWQIRGAITAGLRAYGHHQDEHLRGRWNHASFSALDGEMRTAVDAGFGGVTEDPPPEPLSLEHAVRDAVDTLPPREREVILRRLDGETLAQAGRSLGVSRERVRQIQARAHERLGRELREFADLVA